MADTGAPPVIPVEFQQYNSYVIDPLWQRTFSIIWPSTLAFFVLLSLPHLVRSIRNGRAYSTLFGISEDLNDYTPITPVKARRRKERNTVSWVRKAENCLGIFGGLFNWTIPGLGLNAGQIILLAAYVVTVLLCIVLEAPLVSNSNRAGFIALAQFPIVFLFATKNSIVSLLLGPGNGYEKLNFIHRWSGRTMFLGAVLHGALWIRNHLQYGLDILGEQKETSGIAALGVLGVIVITSLKPFRRACYEVFFGLHILGFVAFFVTICYHTIYATPWIFPPLAFYGFDILMRMFRHRIKDAILVPVDNQMTLIHVPHSSSGWVGGQHIRLRVFFSGRVFESHPLTIFSATPDISCISSLPQGISLGARVSGDWTRALNKYATLAGSQITDLEECNDPTMEKEAKSKSSVEVPVQVMIEGPYGGSSVDLGNYETALLFAGGSGITFTLGLLDDIVGRCVRKGRMNGEKTKRIEFAWCVRSFGSIEWFSSALMDIATVAATSHTTSSPIDVHMSIYVTCLCNPEAIPPIPNCDVTIIRPSIYHVLNDLITPNPPQNSDMEAILDVQISESDLAKKGSILPRLREGGGVAVCASGPQSLTREAANAVARLQMRGLAVTLGGIALHTEVFSL
ncbi:ferric reductase like transmembrane component-domain-containing protein [Crassisporium funariophilum]|nr:ferric reductase like transmembrane component-domain-containing protein [Crassisporium funariophilum]